LIKNAVIFNDASHRELPNIKRDFNNGLDETSSSPLSPKESTEPTSSRDMPFKEASAK